MFLSSHRINVSLFSLRIVKSEVHNNVNISIFVEYCPSVCFSRVLCNPSAKFVHAQEWLVFVNRDDFTIYPSVYIFSLALLSSTQTDSNFLLHSQMAARLHFVRSAWLSSHLCRASSQSIAQIQNLNSSVSARNMSASKASAKCLQMENINPCIKTMEYAVR